MSDDNGFTNKEILLQLNDKVDAGFEDLKKLYSEGHGDHENRIRSLEEIRSRLFGIILFVSVLTPAIITLVVYNKI